MSIQPPSFLGNNVHAADLSVIPVCNLLRPYVECHQLSLASTPSVLSTSKVGSIFNTTSTIHGLTLECMHRFLLYLRRLSDCQHFQPTASGSRYARQASRPFRLRYFACTFASRRAHDKCHPLLQLAPTLSVAETTHTSLGLTEN